MTVELLDQLSRCHQPVGRIDEPTDLIPVNGTSREVKGEPPMRAHVRGIEEPAVLLERVAICFLDLDQHRTGARRHLAGRIGLGVAAVHQEYVFGGAGRRGGTPIHLHEYLMWSRTGYN